MKGRGGCELVRNDPSYFEQGQRWAGRAWAQTILIFKMIPRLKAQQHMYLYFSHYVGRDYPAFCTNACTHRHGGVMVFSVTKVVLASFKLANKSKLQQLHKRNANYLLQYPFCISARVCIPGHLRRVFTFLRD